MKKIVAIVAAAALALALPCSAFAANSSTPTSGSATSAGGSATYSGTPYTGVSGVTANVTISNTPESGCTLVVEDTTTMASNTEINSGDVYVSSTHAWVKKADGSACTTCMANAGSVTVGFSGIPAAYNGKTARVYIQHEGGQGNEVKTTTVSNGSASITMNGLSYVTLVISDSAGSTDSSSKAPQTGLDLTTTAACTFGAIVAAAGVAFVLRRRNED